jgi:hypothetical protein
VLAPHENRGKGAKSVAVVVAAAEAVAATVKIVALASTRRSPWTLTRPRRRKSMK